MSTNTVSDASDVRRGDLELCQQQIGYAFRELQLLEGALTHASGVQHRLSSNERMEFFGDATIVAHNAEFDRNFLNYELELLGRAQLPRERFVDTLVLAREHRPGAPSSLDAVCKRFNISIEGRELHGALKDARLLAMAYLELRGGRERVFDFATNGAGLATGQASHIPRAPRPRPLDPRVSAEEAAAHTIFVSELGESAIWKKYA